MNWRPRRNTGLSPIGGRIVFGRPTEVAVVDADGTNLGQLTVPTLLTKERHQARTVA